MKNIKYKNWIKTGCIGLMATVGLAACSDDHFDVQSHGSLTAGKTIMENIEENGNLNDFAKILDLVSVKRTDIDAKSTFTYAELLKSSQAFTVWAPLDGSYDAQAYIDTLLYARDVLRASGDSMSLIEAVAIERKIENQFVRNHIARFNYEANPNLQQVRMLNSKVYYYGAAEGEFNGSPLVSAGAERDVVSSNGMMHLLEKPSTYFYNIFDYMGEDPDFDSVYTYISSQDKNEFSEYLSTQGALNEKGEMVYVDSVFTNSNVLLNSSGASIKDEDSLYVAVIPTNVGLDSALAKMIPYFKYADSYNQEWSNEKGEFTATGANAFKISDVAHYADSIARNEIITNMYFSVSNLEGVDKSDSASIINAVKSADSLISTKHVIFYDPADMFVNDPLKASNGYIFKSDSYAVDPQKSFLTKSVFPAGLNVVFTKSMRQESITLSEETRNEDVKGEVYNNSYIRFVPSARNAYLEYRLPAVYSGKYKISVELLPSDIHNLYLEDSLDRSTFDAMIVYDDEEDKTNVAKNISIVPDTVQSYVLWEDYEFTKCYANLPSSVTVFPRLRLTVPRPGAKAKAINIVRVTIEPTREEAE